MKIGIDIDDTLINLSEIYYAGMQKWALENEGINPNNQNFFSKDIINGIKDYDTCWNEMVEKEVLCVKCKEGAKEVIDKLLKEGHKIYIITARSNDYVNNFIDKTLAWLKEREINYSDIFFGASDKKDFMKKLKLDVMIDDSIHVMEDAKEININRIIMNTYFNSHYTDCLRAYTWYDIYHHIKRINMS